MNSKVNLIPCRVEVCHKADLLVFDVRDKDHAYTEEIGLVEINTQ